MEINQNEFYHRNILDNMLEGCQIINFDWRYVYINKTAEKQNKRPNEELIGNLVMDMWPGIEDIDQFVLWKKCMNERTHEYIQTEFIFPDGSRGWYELRFEPVPEGIFILSIEISDRKTDEQKIINLNRVYAVLSDINQAIVRIHDKDKLLEQACKIAVDKGEFIMAWIGMIDDNVIKPVAYSGFDNIDISHIYIRLEDSNNLNNPTLKATIEGIPIIYNDLDSINDAYSSIMFMVKDKINAVAAFPLTLSGMVIGNFTIFSKDKDSFNEKEMALLKEMAMDISFGLEFIQQEENRIIAENNLKEYQNVLEMVVKSNPESLLLIEPNGKIIFANEIFAKRILQNLNSILGKNISEVAPLDVYVEKNLHIKNVLKSKKLLKTNDFRLNTHIENYFQPVLNEENEVIYIAIYGTDITDKINIEKEIIKTKNKAEELSQFKTILLRNLNHEIRTPLTGIVGSANILEMEISDTEQLEIIKLMLDSAKRLSATINSIVYLSEIESNKLNVSLEQVFLPSIIGNFVSLFRNVCEKKGLYIKFIRKTNNISIYIDENLFAQIFNYLLDNAVKFTHSGGITITLSTLMTDKENLAVITIQDTGIGIPLEKKDKVFHDFVQIDERLARNFEGIGLGLSLAKKMIEIMNGKIELESQTGVGTTITIKFQGIEML